MTKLIKFIKSLNAKGFATPAEKAELRTLFKELEGSDAEGAEAVKTDVEAAESLPESNPAGDAPASDDGTADEEAAKNAIKGFINEGIKAGIGKVKDEVNDAIAKFIKEQKELIAAQAGPYANGVMTEKRKKINSNLRELAKAVIAGDLAKVKEMTSGEAGEDIVDRELSAEIRHLMSEYGVARREMFTTALSKNSYDANALATDVAISWVTEGNPIPTVFVELNQEELKLKKLAAIATMTRELLEDQEIDLFSFIGARVAEGFAEAEDRAFFCGEGSGDTANGGYTGLLNHASIEEVGGGMTPEGIYGLQDALPIGAHANAKYYGHRSRLSEIRLLKDGDGRYLYQNPLNESGPATLAGKPFVPVEVMPSAQDAQEGDPILLFGDLKKACILGYKNGIAVERFTSGIVKNAANNADVNLITTDRQAMRWVSRVGYMLILPAAVKKLVEEVGS